MTGSVRLTNYDRDNVANAAIKASFEKRSADLKVEADELARRCYDCVIPAAERKAAAAMPSGWLHLDRCLRFNVGGMNIRLDVIGDGLPVPQRASGYCERLGNVADPKLIEDVTAHLSAVEKHKSDRDKAKSSLKALLYSVSTLKALREVWPEGEPFFAGLASKTGAPGLPAPQVTELNAMLGLPVREAA